MLRRVTRNFLEQGSFPKKGKGFLSPPSSSYAPDATSNHNKRNILKQKDKLKLINPFHASGLFLYPLKTSETSAFLMFSGGTERDQCHDIS